ncbi:hypothetical protein K505DRAFT_359649 [Melanomma pulvis-pyrius CBS 109.77]|uniref:Uncharacterized protein n=1 Tax=Melanomma pulvis-pyrius CBS 109.77 TaxID=1314802 RepID=A0A6A6XJD7_9PLEO|nr:hypothetical protein K505DRAFT_359649 [Melanomma pulvis-pyrius CBS 109.77]
MRYLTALTIGILTSLVCALPIDENPKLNTVISNYADVDGFANKRTLNLNTVIGSYADVDGEQKRKATPTAPDEVTPPKEVSPPIGTLDTVIHHYADVEGNVH